MAAGIFHVPTPGNEPVKSYAPGSPERAEIEAELARQSDLIIDIPCVVGGRAIETGNIFEVTNPCDRSQVLARVHLAGEAEVAAAIEAAAEAKITWAALGWQDRVAIFLKAARLLEGRWRARVNASTMLGQAKTVHQAEIDAACELIDFWRFNATYVEQIMGDQPPISGPGVWNRLDHRPLDGFVFAIAPFNFTSIALNLCTAPAMMGNTVLWKPSLTSSLSCWYLFELLQEAGLPPGVINLLNGHGADVGNPVLSHPDLGGVHFTGSTGTFQHIWQTIGANIASYRQYPRIVGETGGKDFIVAHPSADAEAVAIAMLRGGFEFQGQKCSAASRCYIPSNLWPEIKQRVQAGLAEFKQGDVRDLGNFVSAVIDERSFRRIAAYVDLANAEGEVISGGTYDDSTGWYIAPTAVRVDDPGHRLMAEEIFGPVLTIYVYEPDAWDETLRLVDSTSPYALTGGVFATDRHALVDASDKLRYAAGNFYLNDKPTGAVVGQQPFGGGRASGTNDKAGSPLNLLRWVSPRTIKENFDPPRDWTYPFLG